MSAVQGRSGFHVDLVHAARCQRASGMQIDAAVRLG
jgi:hypothetical protein